MTHGEQTKAKTGKSSQASGSQKISSKTAGKTGPGGKGSNAKEGETGKAGKIVVKKDQAGAAAQKGSFAAKEAGNGSKGGGKARSAPAPAPDDVPGFSNPTVENAFKRALKKYPNALRKLTD